VEITRPFLLQKTPVTQTQWMAVMGDNPSHFKSVGSKAPVENVSWYDAQRFIERLNQFDSAKTYRLPTEAEWEYACKAGVDGEYGFSGAKPGDNIDVSGYAQLVSSDVQPRSMALWNVAWYEPNSRHATRPVATKLPNDWGLYDMIGNVWEWVADWSEILDDYEDAATQDPVGSCLIDTGDRRLKGGCFGSAFYDARASVRHGNPPGHKSEACGFRLAKTVV
jgi:formylglycine-generating enzyme required for sulfatase activity